jgi:peptidoglycan/xylan/chitin deacetylase (PgdA/CDA1 family)
VGRVRIALPTRTRKRLTRVADAGARRVLPLPDSAGRRVVLCYHSVTYSPGDLSLSPDLFDRHLAWLEDHCQVVPLEELVAGSRGTRGPYVALTFDDGYADNHANALPLLAARGMPASFFVTVGFLERDADVMAHLAEVWETPGGELRPLSWAEVRELRGAGMSVGSHTWSHRNLARLSPGAAEHDLRRSREVLEERLGERVRAVAYPWGKLGRHVTDETFAAGRRAGFELGVISLPRAIRESDGALRVARLGVGDEPVERLAAKVAGAIDWHAHVHEHMPPPVARLLFAEDATA